jgi:hypothetical protein
VGSPAELREQLPSARALVVESFAVGKDELAGAPKLKVVHKYGAILRNIDVAVRRRRRQGARDTAARQHRLRRAWQPTCLQSITVSARRWNDGGSVRPNALAVQTLITNSNFVGCDIGKSAGLEPFRIRLAYTPAWR